jgi:hypothetical protein
VIWAINDQRRLAKNTSIGNIEQDHELRYWSENTSSIARNKDDPAISLSESSVLSPGLASSRCGFFTARQGCLVASSALRAAAKALHSLRSFH